VRSFETPRPRSAPTSYFANSRDGHREQRDLHDITLVIAIKTACDGCRAFVESDLEELTQLKVPFVIVSASHDETGEWANARHQIDIAPELLQELEVRWPPFYVLIDVETSKVVVEGVVFGPAQVAEEIQPYLTF
jgi:hypothetical protein